MSQERVFDARADSIGAIRAYVEDALLRNGAGDTVIDTAILCTSELATNALLHGDGPIGVVVDIRHGDRARVVVHDRNIEEPAPRRPAVDEESGRGLLLVGMFADEWGVTPDDGGKAVWFEVDLRAAAPAPERPVGRERRRWGSRAVGQRN